MLNLGNVTVTLRAKNSIGRLCKCVQYLKSDVVAGIGIFRSNVPKAGNQVFQDCNILQLLLSFGGSSGSTSSSPSKLNGCNNG